MPKDPDQDSTSPPETKPAEPKEEAAPKSKAPLKPKKAATPPPPPVDEPEDDEDEDDEEEDDGEVGGADDEDGDADEDGDEDDEDEDEDEDEEEPPPRPVQRARARPASGSYRARPPAKPRVQMTEEEIGTPSKQTLGMILILAVLVLVMWTGARLACNVRGGETKKPRTVTTEELAREPKDAALELAQRWAGYDFDGALELAKGPVVAQIEADRKSCEGNAECNDKKKALADKPLASAELLARDVNASGEPSAVVRVKVLDGKGAGAYILKLEHEATIWKAVERKLDDGTTVISAPASPTTPTSASAVPSSSGAPATSGVAQPKAPMPVAPAGSAH